MYIKYVVEGVDPETGEFHQFNELGDAPGFIAVDDDRHSTLRFVPEDTCVSSRMMLEVGQSTPVSVDMISLGDEECASSPSSSPAIKGSVLYTPSAATAAGSDVATSVKKVYARLPSCPRPRLSCKIILAVYETERFFPIIGWGKKRLPTDRPQWSDRAGKVACPLQAMDQHVKDQFFEYDSATTEWQCYKKATETDDEGWQYSVDFPQTFHDHQRHQDFVRRRAWHRTIVPRSAFLHAGMLKLGDLTPFVARKCFTPFHGDLVAMKQLEAIFLKNMGDCCLDELVGREQIDREAIETIGLDVANSLASWINDDYSKQQAVLTSQASMVLDRWHSLRGPRQAALDLSISEAKNLVLPDRVINSPLPCRARIVVHCLATNETIESEPVPIATSSAVAVNFRWHAILPDDTKAILVTLEAIGEGIVEWFGGPEPLAVVPLNLRGTYSSLRSEVNPLSQVYKESCDVLLQCLDGSGQYEIKTKMRVAWTLEPREGDFVEFCDDCGNMVSRCVCSPEVIDARYKKRGLEAAQRQAEVYAARAARIAKQREEEQAKKLAEQRRNFAQQQSVEISAEEEQRKKKRSEYELERERIQAQFFEGRLHIQKAQRRREVLYNVFKLRLMELEDQRRAFASSCFSTWKESAHCAARNRLRDDALRNIDAAISLTQSQEVGIREEIRREEDAHWNQLCRANREIIDDVGEDMSVERVPVTSAVVKAVEETREQQLQRQEPKQSTGCCSLM